MCSAGSCFIYNFIIIYYRCYCYYYFSPPRVHRSPSAAVPQRRGPLFPTGGRWQPGGQLRIRPGPQVKPLPASPLAHRAPAVRESTGGSTN